MKLGCWCFFQCTYVPSIPAPLVTHFRQFNTPLIPVVLLAAPPPPPTSYVNVLFQLTSHSDQVTYLKISCRAAQQHRERSCCPNWYSSIPPTTVSMIEAIICGPFSEAKRMSSPTQLSLPLPAPFCIGAIKHVRKSSQKSPQKKPQEESKLTGQHKGEEKGDKKNGIKTF